MNLSLPSLLSRGAVGLQVWHRCSGADPHQWHASEAPSCGKEPGLCTFKGEDARHQRGWSRMS